MVLKHIFALMLLLMLISPVFAITIGNTSTTTTSFIDATSIVRTSDGTRWMIYNNNSANGIVVTNTTSNLVTVINFTSLGQATTPIGASGMGLRNDGTVIFSTSNMITANRVIFWNISSGTLQNATIFTPAGTTQCLYPMLMHRDNVGMTIVCDRGTYYSGDYGTTWTQETSPVGVGDQQGALTQLENGSRIVLYHEAGSYRYAISNQSGTWSTANIIITPVTILDQKASMIAVGNTWIAAVGMKNGTDANFTTYFIIGNSSGTFVVRSNFSRTDDHTYPQLRIDTLGNRYVFWDNNAGLASSTSSCFMAKNTTDGWYGWTTAQTLQNGNGCSMPYPRGVHSWINYDQLNVSTDERLDYGWLQVAATYTIHLDNTTINALPPDSITPTVAIQSPSGSYNITNISLLFTSSDNVAVTFCKYSVDGAVNISLPSCANITFQSSLGSHSITVFANDSIGNTGSASSSFSIVAASTFNNSTAGTLMAGIISLLIFILLFLATDFDQLDLTNTVRNIVLGVVMSGVIFLLLTTFGN